MKRLRAVLVAVAVVVPSFSASAATVGLDGGNSDPIFITDPAWQLLTEANCADPGFSILPADYRCALYDGSAVGNITSIDVRLKDGNGNLIPFPDGIAGDPNSDLEIFGPSLLFPDGFTFNLSTIFTFDCFTCRFFSSHPDGLDDPLYVSIVGVNGVANVPEPAPLLLLAPAALALRRRVREMITWTPRRGRGAARNADR